MLVDIGFMALGHGRTEEARQIFDGVAILRPGSEAVQVAEATYMLATGEAHKAVDLLKKTEPSDTASVMLAVAMLGARQGKDAMALLEETIAAYPESDFAKRVLNELQVSLSNT